MPVLQSKGLVLALLILGAPLAGMFLPLLAPLWHRSRRSISAWASVLGWGTRLLSALSLLGSLGLALVPISEPIRFPIGMIDFYLDALSVYFVLLVNLVAFFASWYAADYLRFNADAHNKNYKPALFHFLFNTFHLTMLIVPMIDNLVILWIGMELTTLASALLVSFRRTREKLEAAWKYIIITSAGIVFALFGTILLIPSITYNNCEKIRYELNPSAPDCAFLNSISLMHWSFLGQPKIAQALEPHLLTLSFLFVLVGYGTKAGLAPMHTWLPDVHGEAPSPVSALLSGVLLKSALYAILRFYTIMKLNQPSTTYPSAALLSLGLLSLVLATPFILKQNKFKRVLAYHSLEHIGIIAFGIGIGGPIALFGALLHSLNHALTKALMFLGFEHVRQRYAECLGSTELDERAISGVLRTMPASGLLLLLGGLGLVGAPPFNLFLSELIMLWAALDKLMHPQFNDFPRWVYLLAISLFLFTITMIFGGLVGHLSRLLLGRPALAFAGITEWRPFHLLPLLALLLIITLMGVWLPTWPINIPKLIDQSVCILEHGAAAKCPP